MRRGRKPGSRLPWSLHAQLAAMKVGSVRWTGQRDNWVQTVILRHSIPGKFKTTRCKVVLPGNDNLTMERVTRIERVQ